MTRVHSKEKEDKKPLECSICSKSFPRLSHLQRHQLIHIKDREWGCPFCEQSFVQKVSLLVFFYRHRPWLLCSLVCATYCNNLIFQNTHRPLKCKHCGEVFDGYGNFRAHELRQRAQSFECSCGASFSRASLFRIHRDSCRKRGSFLCIVCDRLFTQRVQLDRHWKKEHFVSAQCAECGWIAAAPLRKAEHALEFVCKKSTSVPLFHGQNPTVNNLTN
ncbi:unnamed protein product [Haemonchus placei]|uniref:C2H2-type domain-containing protein n=1 Tax=Haemonchus placei TaxID=6290 RepID=A0A0N4W0R3_HAEPC|nr:unnamed protein product [Haemonchus placei]